MKTPTTGDLSLIVRYKGKEGYVASLGEEAQDLTILQLQGGRQEGYRVSSGLAIVPLLAEQIRLLAEHPDSPYEHLFMPPIVLIQGIIDAASEQVIRRYEELAQRVGLTFSQVENRFVRKLR